MRKGVSFQVAMVIILGLCLTSCSTYGTAGGLGAVLGAGTGAIIGNQSGHSGQGALIGAVVGGLAGLIIHDIQQRQLASKSDVEKQMQQNGETVPTTPVVYVDALNVTPAKVEAGQKVTLKGTYRAIGPGEDPVAGKVVFQKDNRPLTSDKPLTFSGKTGENTFEAPLTLAADAADGVYTADVVLARGGYEDQKSATFEVVSGPIATTGSSGKNIHGAPQIASLQLVSVK